jgi:uncharacterized membrane protein
MNVKSILKDNIITNPIGWANSLVGTNLRYRVTQLCVIVFGILLACMIFISFPDHYWMIYIGPIAFTFIFAVELPILCLRAMRHLIIKINQSEPKDALNSDSAVAKSE